MVKTKNFEYYILAAWLFVMMVLPDVPSTIKLGVMFLYILVTLFLHKKITVNKSMLQWALAWEVLFIFEHVYNWAIGNAFSFELFEIFLVRPVLLFIMASFFVRKDSFLILFKIILFVTICILLYNIVFIMQSFGLIPVIIREEKSLVIISSSFLTIRSSNLTAQMFLTPFMVILSYKRKVFPPKMRKIILLPAGILVVISMLSGRRALQVITLFSLFVIFTLFVIEREKITVNGMLMFAGLVTVGVIAIVVVNNSLGYNLLDVIKLTILDSLDRKSFGRGVRDNQFIALSRSWIENPVLGSGISSYSQYYMSLSGGIYTSWSYELFYNALLMQIGILGMGWLLFYLFKIIKKMLIFYRCNKENEYGAIVIAVIMGLTGFLICGVSNPMATSSWMWFIVLSAFSFSSFNLDQKKFD